jgi:hypothetical protein
VLKIRFYVENQQNLMKNIWNGSLGDIVELLTSKEAERTILETILN